MEKRIGIPILFVVLMWIINTIQFIFHLDFGGLGIHPKDKSTLIGIFTSPLIHGSWEHLLSNTLPLFIFGVLLFLIYPSIALRVWIFNYIITGFLVWCFARTGSYHIGASGIIYGLGAFLLFSGFLRMDIGSIAIASGVSIFYGGMVWGLFPLQPNVSWESHVLGGITGAVLAVIYRHKKEVNTDLSDEHTENIKRKTFEDYINQ
jgi:membrane associated rhomboid family serine protease